MSPTYITLSIAVLLVVPVLLFVSIAWLIAALVMALMGL